MQQKDTSVSLGLYNSLNIMQECAGKFSYICHLQLPRSHSPSWLYKEDIKVSPVVAIVISLPGGRDWTYTAQFCALCPE